MKASRDIRERIAESLCLPWVLVALFSIVVVLILVFPRLSETLAAIAQVGSAVAAVALAGLTFMYAQAARRMASTMQLETQARLRPHVSASGYHTEYVGMMGRKVKIISNIRNFVSSPSSELKIDCSLHGENIKGDTDLIQTRR